MKYNQKQLDKFRFLVLLHLIFFVNITKINARYLTIYIKTYVSLSEVKISIRFLYLLEKFLIILYLTKKLSGILYQIYVKGQILIKVSKRSGIWRKFKQHSPKLIYLYVLKSLKNSNARLYSRTLEMSYCKFFANKSKIEKTSNNL